jgi:hypothetical protein
MLFAILAVTAQLDRDYIREKTLEGQRAAAARGNHGGRPKVIDDDTLNFARALRDRGLPIPEIAKKLTTRPARTPGRTRPSLLSIEPSRPRQRTATWTRSLPRRGRWPARSNP